MSTPDGGWNLFRALGLIAGVLGMVGFGLCSVTGLITGLGGGGGGGIVIILVFVIPGFVIAYLSFLLARAMVRRAARTGPPGKS